MNTTEIQKAEKDFSDHMEMCGELSREIDNLLEIYCTLKNNFCDHLARDVFCATNILDGVRDKVEEFGEDIAETYDL